MLKVGRWVRGKKNEPMVLNDINVVISTVGREEDYLGETLNSLSVDQSISEDNPVCLVAGSPVTTHLDRYRTESGISIIEMGPSTWSWIKDSSVLKRSAWNCYRCLTQPKAGIRGTLALEDDIHFARGWRARFSATLTELERHHGLDFVLAVYSPWLSATEEHNYGKLSVEYPPEKFLGLQGIYYTSRTRQGFAKYLKIHGLVVLEKAHDLLLGDYLAREGIPLFATSPSLVQHIGKKSSLESQWHDSQLFMEDVTVLPSEHLP